MGDDNDRATIARIINEHFPDAKVILFGSRARGDYYPDSDYDIAIITDVDDKNKAYQTISKPLHDAIDAPFDIVFYTPEEYENGKDGFLPELIEQEGVKLST